MNWYYPEADSKAPLPLIISGAASKMRGKHSPFAEQQEIRYKQMKLLWSKSFVWGFARVEVNNAADRFEVAYYTTPTDGSGELMAESKFSFGHRSY